jgi:hypothetical protein
VAKYNIDQDDLKARYHQIVDFYFVSSYTLQGIDNLVKKLIQVTLDEKYIGECVPVKYYKQNILNFIK